MTYWKLRYHQSRQGPVNPTRLHKLQKELIIQDRTKSKVEVKMKLKEAWAKLRKTQKRHKLLREEHLGKLAEFYATQRDTTKAQE